MGIGGHSWLARDAGCHGNAQKVSMVGAAHTLSPDADRAFCGPYPLAAVCGVDEAGRGPLAGPVVVAAVMLDPADPIDGLADSKRLAAPKREALYERICHSALVGVSIVSARTISERNIRGATLLGMTRSVSALPMAPALALIDGRDVPAGLACDGLALIKGDGRSPSIAAASIVAKVTRDRLMMRLDAAAPAYGFAQHKGYPTPAHLAALARYGPSRFHRLAFAPVRAALKTAPAALSGGRAG